MKKLWSKRKNKKGFTLAELLIVVAIIAVLVAVSIPVFTSQLEKSREATDVANMRAAKAGAVTAYLSADLDTSIWTENAGKYTAYYDAQTGLMSKTSPTNKYGKGTSTDGGTTGVEGYSATTAYTGQVVKVVITGSTGAVELSWE